MWTWSISAVGKKLEVVDAVNAAEPPTIDAGSVDIDDNEDVKQKMVASLHGFDAVPEERAALRAAVRARGGSKKEEAEVAVPAYERDDVELPTKHRDKFDEAKVEILDRLSNIADDHDCSLSVSGNAKRYKIMLRDLTAEAADTAKAAKGEK